MVVHIYHSVSKCYCILSFISGGQQLWRQLNDSAYKDTSPSTYIFFLSFAILTSCVHIIIISQYRIMGKKSKKANKKRKEKGKKKQQALVATTKSVHRPNRLVISKLKISDKVSSAFETIVINNDTLESIVKFLGCKDLVNLSLTSKRLAYEINKVALRMISSLNARYGGEDINELAVLDELNHLRSPLVWNELLGNRIGYVNGDKACAYSSNPNRLHTAYYIGEQTMEGSFDDWDGTEQTAIASDYIMTSVSISYLSMFEYASSLQ